MRWLRVAVRGPSVPHHARFRDEGVGMPRARWLTLGALSVLTAAVLALDATGVIFDDPQSAPEPPALVLPSPAAADLAAPLPIADAPIDDRVIGQVRDLLDDDALGESVHAEVVPLGQALDASDPSLVLAAEQPATPASTLKLWTAIAALDAFPVDARLATTVTWDDAAGTLTLVGGGDTTLTTEREGQASEPSLEQLARSTARELRALDVDGVRLTYDASLFTGPSVSPQWEPTYVSTGVIAPVSALMADDGRITPDSAARYSDPAEGAATAFARQLEGAGVRVRGPARVGAAASSEPLAVVESMPLIDLVERMLRDSDNQLAESLGRLAAADLGYAASFGGAAKALLRAARGRGVDVGTARVYDASGLSRQDRMPVDATTSALLAAAAEPPLAPVLSGLPVAGFDGTMADRFVQGEAAQAAGLVRAKTGTLTGISAEAGVALTCRGELVAYAFVADEVVDTVAARDALDAAAAALTACPGRG